MNKHKEKVRIARSLTGGHLHTFDDKGTRGKLILFSNPRWMERRMQIAYRVERQQGEAHEKALERKKLKTQ